MVDTKILQPPKVKDGYLSQEAIQEFFSQIYEIPTSLQRHLDNVYSRLLSATWYGTLTLGVRCQKCHKEMKAVSCINRKSVLGHWGKEERRHMEISVSDLRELSLAEFKTGTRHTGEAAYEDFKLLRSYL